MRSLPTRSTSFLALGFVAIALGACHGNRAETTGSIYPSDVRERHPYVLRDGTRTLDVFPTGAGHLDPRQAADIDGFLLEFRRYGRGVLALDIPRGGAPGTAASVERTAAAIRRIAADNGVAPGAVAIAVYPIANPGLAAPLRLSFRAMQAGVADRCGVWPQDLGVADATFNLRNEPYWNLGCSLRANVAAQAADPIDLVRGRQDGRIDTVRRMQVIDKLRTGNDPSTTWKQDGTASVKSGVGN